MGMEDLSSAFLASIQIVKEHLSGGYLFLLTDEGGELIAMDNSPGMETLIEESPIRLGLVFSEDNCGVNAISEAMSSRSPVYFKPEQHGNVFFQTWHCFATPLLINNELLGYLDVSTIDEEMKSELIAIAKLVSIHMIDTYRQPMQAQEAIVAAALTERQLCVLKLISEGLTVKSIALKLEIKESTVNHHKKVIFEKLGVQSSAEAVRIASQLSYL